MSDVHRLALHVFIVSVITRILDPPHVRVTMPYSGNALNVTFARTIAWCLSTMSWAVNTSLGIASDIESTTLLC